MSFCAFPIWLDAVRLRTLPLAMLSVLVGSALAAEQKHFSLTIFLLASLTALLLQILSNLANDYGDHVQGTDNKERIGPKRVMQQGLISTQKMKKALMLNILCIIICGTSLILYALKDSLSILPFFAFGVLAIAAALCYTLGNKPYGYQGLGDLAVLIFFGWVGVLGSFYLHTATMNFALFLPATATGLLATAVLNINNLRDIDNDRTCNKRTLVVRIGEKNARIYHQLLLSLSFGCLVIFTLVHDPSFWHWLFLLCAPLAIKQGQMIWQIKEAKAMQPMLAKTLGLAVLTNGLFILPFFC